MQVVTQPQQAVAQGFSDGTGEQGGNPFKLLKGGRQSRGLFGNAHGFVGLLVHIGQRLSQPFHPLLREDFGDTSALFAEHLPHRQQRFFIAQFLADNVKFLQFLDDALDVFQGAVFVVEIEFDPGFFQDIACFPFHPFFRHL